LVINNIYPNLLHTSSDSLFGVAMGIFLLSEILFTIEISNINKKLTGFENNEILSCNDLNTTLVNALTSKRHIKHIRIFALSTNVIQPIVRSTIGNEIKIKKCSLLIRNLNNKDYNNNFGTEIITIIDRWKDMKGNSIDNFDIAFFDDIPTDYNIIIDDNLAIIGNYIFTEKDKSHVTIGYVVSVRNSRESGAQMINSYIKRFDESFEYFKKKNGNYIRGSQECLLS